MHEMCIGSTESGKEELESSSRSQYTEIADGEGGRMERGMNAAAVISSRYRLSVRTQWNRSRRRMAMMESREVQKVALTASWWQLQPFL